MPDIPLNKLLQEISISVKQAQSSLDFYQLDLFRNLLDNRMYSNFLKTGTPADGQTLSSDGEKEDGEEGDVVANKAVTPASIDVPYPDGKGGYFMRKIPLLALLNHSSLQLNEVRVKINLDSLKDEENGLRVSLGGSNTEGEEGTVNQKNNQQIELVLKRGEPSEGISRLTDELIKVI